MQVKQAIGFLKASETSVGVPDFRPTSSQPRPCGRFPARGDVARPPDIPGIKGPRRPTPSRAGRLSQESEHTAHVRIRYCERFESCFCPSYEASLITLNDARVPLAGRLICINRVQLLLTKIKAASLEKAASSCEIFEGS